MSSTEPEVVAPIEQVRQMLATLDDLAVADHPSVFESAHQILRDQLNR